MIKRWKKQTYVGHTFYAQLLLILFIIGTIHCSSGQKTVNLNPDNTDKTLQSQSQQSEIDKKNPKVFILEFSF